MPNRYVSVPVELFHEKFTAAGFTRVVNGHEVVYERPCSDPRFIIRAFTSCYEKADMARGVGEDAIRVALVFAGRDGTRHGAAKSARVLRVGTADAVVERTLQRCRDMWATAAQMSRNLPFWLVPHA